MSNSDWFSRKLGTPTPQQPQAQPQYAAPQPATYAQPQQPQYPPSQQATPQAPRCPGCGSGNYGSVQGAKPRCYDCGYPINQSGSRYGALTGAKVEGTTKSAAGNDTASNWNPQVIIGRIN